MGVKTLTVITALGLSIIGLVIWVYFASEGHPGIDKCTNDTSRSGVCTRPDGSIWLVDMSGQLRLIQPGHR
jgi:hypothetical protein